MDSTNQHQNSNQAGSINDRAQARFTEIKNRMKLNLFDGVISKENYPQRDVDKERIQQLLDHPEQNDKFTVKDEVVQQLIEKNRKFVDDTFSYIDALPVNATAKMAIGMAIHAFTAEDEELFKSSIDRLEEAFYGPKENNS